MKNLFRHIDPQSFHFRFNDEEQCLGYLADVKWKDGFTCRKCGHKNYCAGKTPFARRCTRCKSEESATAHTIFHRCKISLVDAFRITYAVCYDPAVSTYELSRDFELRQMTCWKFRKKVKECLESQEPDRDLQALMQA